MGQEFLLSLFALIVLGRAVPNLRVFVCVDNNFPTLPPPPHFRNEAVVLELHGCVHCNDFVFRPTSRELRCPLCNHPRFNSNKKPNEVFWYIPLKNQLLTLLKNPEYRELLLWETRRGSATGYMSDVYDTPRWREVAGEATKTLSRIVYQICVDAFPWQSRKHGVCDILNSN